MRKRPGVEEGVEEGVRVPRGEPSDKSETELWNAAADAYADGEGCAPSFHGPMCSVCKDGTSARLGVCEPCDDATQSRTVGALIGGSVALVVLCFGGAMWFVRQARAEAGRRGLIETAITFYKDKYDEKAANESGSDDDNDALAPEVPDPESARPPAAPPSPISPALFTTRATDALHAILHHTISRI